LGQSKLRITNVGVVGAWGTILKRKTTMKGLEELRETIHERGKEAKRTMITRESHRGEEVELKPTRQTPSRRSRYPRDLRRA